ncbi:MAG: isochorismatase family protein [Candidatus Obscuribacterales bacterium]
MSSSDAEDGTLVVVDMQQHFIEGCENADLLANVIAEIQAAMARGWAIILLDVDPERLGPTVMEITSVVQGYQRCRQQTKAKPNGSSEVLDVCFEENYSNSNFKVVGVWIDACVEQTAVSLVERLSSCVVNVVKKACSTNWDEKGAWQAFRQRSRLMVA